jgi:DNA-directed RNA polymerase specialized sigma subunit
MTKEFLQNHLTKLEEAKGLEFEIQQMYQTLKSPIITGMPAVHSPDTDKLGNVLWKIQEKEIKYLAKLDVILNEEKDIEKVIDALKDSRERTIMRYRYISGLEWEEVCVKSHYSWKHTHRLHSSALNKINLM